MPEAVNLSSTDTLDRVFFGEHTENLVDPWVFAPQVHTLATMEAIRMSANFAFQSQILLGDLPRIDYDDEGYPRV